MLIINIENCISRNCKLLVCNPLFYSWSSGYVWTRLTYCLCQHAYCFGDKRSGFSFMYSNEWKSSVIKKLTLVIYTNGRWTVITICYLWSRQNGMGTDIVIPMCHNLTSDLNYLMSWSAHRVGEKKKFHWTVHSYIFFKKCLCTRYTKYSYYNVSRY